MIETPQMQLVGQLVGRACAYKYDRGLLFQLT